MAIEAITLNAYEAANYKEVKSSKEWVLNGSDNLFPQYLIDLYNSSPVHKALVDGISSRIAAMGWKADGSALSVLKSWAVWNELDAVALDRKLQGGFALEVTYSTDRTKIVDVSHCPFERVRVAPMDEDGKIKRLFYSLDWSDTQKNTPIPVPAFGEQDYETNNNEEWSETEILYVKPFSVGSQHYPKPDYLGSMNWIEVAKQIALLHNSNLQNGMHPGFAIHWKNGVPPKHRREQIRQEIEEQITGVEKAGKFFMTFSNGGEETPDLVPFDQSNISDMYKLLSQEATDNIMIGHRVTSPAMFGVKTAGQLGATEELKISSELFDRDVIEPQQKDITQAIEELLKKAEAPGSVSIEKRDLSLFSQEAEDMSEDEEIEWLEHLEQCGEKIDEDEWELIDEKPVDDPEAEEMVHLEQVKFFESYANEGDKSEIDTGLYKIRYRYSRGLKPNSRFFCVAMVGFSESGTVYRFEDIAQMSKTGVNGRFAPKGKKKYDIWKYKGGVYCHHKWIRQVYFRKRDARGRFMPNEGLKNDARVTVQSARARGVPFKDIQKDWKTANTRPIDTPSRGRKT